MRWERYIEKAVEKVRSCIKGAAGDAKMYIEKVAEEVRRVYREGSGGGENGISRRRRRR